MKKISKYVFAGVVLLSLIVACSKEVTDDLITSFNVEFSVTTTDSFFKIPKPTEFTITGASTVPSDYSLKYSVTEGAGVYSINNRDIEENQFVALSSLSNTISYTATSVGTNRVTITIKDKAEREEELVLTYNVKETDFTLEVIPTPASTYVGGIIDLNLKISESNPATYEQ